jgi:glycosyltransferase involved in cell wall biosynthesis
VTQLLVSVVVPTRNRPARLARLVASLRAQSLAPDQFEVVIVDDGGEPAAESMLDGEREAGSMLDGEPGDGRLQLRLLRQPVALGPAAARNAGWRMARAALIAFTDDDCVADRDWLRQGLSVHAEHPGKIVQGATQPDPAELIDLGLFSRTVTVDGLGPQYETCNIFYPRQLLESLGGFDESFGPRPTAEDTDLAWRAIESGSESVFAPEAIVLHAVQRLGAAGMLRIAARWAPAVRMFADHPQTRAMLYRGVFWNVWHYLLWRSLLALAGPAWLRRLVLARHLHELSIRAREQAAGPAGVPFLLACDAVECWSVARGAVRHRTLVL